MSGWNGSDRRGISTPVKPKVTAKKPSPIRGILAGGLVVVLAAIAYLAFFTGSEKTLSAVKEKERGKIKEVKPSAAPVYKEVAKRTTSKVVEKDPPVTNWRAWLMKKAEKDPQLMFHLTNKVGKVVEPTFPSSVEQAMDWVFNCVPGDNPLPLPDLSEEDPTVLVNALIAVNEAKDDDDDDILVRKENVMLAKKELRQYIKDGGEYADFMKYYRDTLVQYHKLWLDAQDSIEHAPEDLDHDQLNTLVEKTNAMLAEKGIKPIELNDVVRDRLGLPEAEEEDVNPDMKPKEEKK